MSTEKEILDCIKIYKKFKNNRIVLVHCVSNYPCSHKSLNMNVLPRLKKKFKFVVGFSDHSIGHEASVASVALGAKVIEKHFTTNKKFKGPDHNASSSPKEFKKIVNEIRKLEIIMEVMRRYAKVKNYKCLKFREKVLHSIIQLKKGIN